MAETDDSVLLRPKTVGMDTVPPYAVYVDGVEVARHNSESEAARHFDQLAGREQLLGEVSHV